MNQYVEYRGITVPKKTYDQSVELVTQTIQSMSPDTLTQMFGGYEADIDRYIEDMIFETCQVIMGTQRDVGTSASTIAHVERDLKEQLRCTDMNYFIDSVFGSSVDMNWHHIQWGMIATQKDRIALLAARDHGKCEEENTEIIMHDGSIKKLKDVQVGDKVMGPSGTPNTVEHVHRGEGNLYRVKQSRGDDYVVNGNHILTIYRRETNKLRDCKVPEIIDIPIKEFMGIAPNTRETIYRGYKVCVPYREQVTPLEPYFFGLWLGDGNSHNQVITTADVEVEKYLEGYAYREGKVLRKYESTYRGRASSLGIVDVGTKKGRESDFRGRLNRLGVLRNKHIPDVYMINSKKVRLEVLAGIIDSDGYVRDNVAYVTFKDELLASSLRRLANELGFKVTMRKTNKHVKYLGSSYESYLITISGDLHVVPIRIERKKAVCNTKTRRNHKQPQKLNGYDITILSSLKVEECGVGRYVGIQLDGDHRYLHTDGTVVHNSFFWSGLYPMWKLYRYKSDDPAMVKAAQDFGFLFSHTDEKAYDYLTGMKEMILDNDILRERLFMETKENWARGRIRTRNGCRIVAKGFGTRARGYHPGWIICDDVLHDNALYSPAQRSKAIDYFYSVVTPMCVPGGQILVIGTPFHSEDLYSTFRKKNVRKKWTYAEYPSIFPDGRILWSERYSFEQLMALKEEAGNVRFSREYLCRPIASASSIFPYEILRKSITGTSKYKLINNIEASPMQFSKIVMGCDFARSANVGADYTVFTVWGVDEMGTMWLLNCWRKLGASFNEQIGKIRELNSNFHPHMVVMENNNFQDLYSQYLQDTGIPVKPHTTGGSKNDLQHGLPSLAVLFERGKIKLPYGDEASKNISDIILSEFNSVTFTDKGLQSVSGHDDTCMSTWFARLATIFQDQAGFEYTWI